MNRELPVSVTDVLLHQKDTDLTERVVLPFTRYKNVLNAPNLVTSTSTVKGAPFLLYKSGSETLSTAEIRELVGGIF